MPTMSDTTPSAVPNVSFIFSHSEIGQFPFVDITISGLPWLDFDAISQAASTNREQSSEAACTTVPSRRLSGLSWPDFDTIRRAVAASEKRQPDTVYDIILNCKLIRIIHRYKNLLTEGDAGGKSVYTRKMNIKAPLQNQSLRLPIAYVIYPKQRPETQTVEIAIQIFTNHAVPSTITENGKLRVLSPEELERWVRMFGEACFHDVQIYLQDCWEKAQRTHTDPDYYGFAKKS